MLHHRADAVVVEADLKRGGCDHQLTPGTDAGILGTRARYIELPAKIPADLLKDTPVLPGGKGSGTRGAFGRAFPCQQLVLCIAQVRVQAVRDIKVVGEDECTVSRSPLSKPGGLGIEQPGEEEARLDRSREQ